MRVLVVGLGSMGRRRLRNITHLGGHELAGFDVEKDRRTTVEREFAVPTFASFEEALGWAPRALVISTPPDLHTPYALSAVEHGLHFFTEASVVPGETSALIAAVDGTDLVAAPSCTLRFHPGIQTMRRLIQEGAIGRPLIATHHVGQYLPDWHPWEDYRSYYVARRETGAAREIVPFELNWMSYLFGATETVIGFRGKLSDLEVDIDDTYAGVVSFASGLRATLVVEVISRPAIRRARIVGELGTLEWDFAERTVRSWTAAEDTWSEHPDPPPVEGPGGAWVAENMYIEEMRGYLAAVEGEPDAFPFSLRDDAHLLQTLAAFERSSDEGRRLSQPS
jgi:predicted dehydrogenase